MSEAQAPSAALAPTVLPFPRQRPFPQDSTARAAFADYYRQDFLSLTRFVMRLGATAYEAADAAQSAFVLAYEQWESLRNPRAWVRTVAKRRLHVLRSGTAREQPAISCRICPEVGVRWRLWNWVRKRLACMRR
ncbi:hypothetical protein SSPO_000970 [Streptomyces antimycoticus]|uniref:RNA polymerase sigma-70 region 2 domain-containing protein n=1 Tax=Streptomyces antimycoticus TaxID=68175 RepID=A0A499UJZ0_9ACTN|nr:sigma factor [Streptomyces antimycoticus]BBJ37379.1 hypothetical protein SSPO_000970 [Streptomyces antimycoticus]